MSSIKEIMQFCRLCLVKDQVNVAIFEEHGDTRDVKRKISACLPVTVSEEDRLPKKICDGCLYKLDLLYQFRTTCVSAEKQLQVWLDELNNSESISKDDEVLQLQHTQTSVKEEIIDSMDHQEKTEYVVEQQQISYEEGDIPYNESQDEIDDGDATNSSDDEPLAKRRKRILEEQQRLQIAETSKSTEGNNMAVTKLEHESDDENVDDPEPNFVSVSNDDQQPGPSGLNRMSTTTNNAEIPKTWIVPAPIQKNKTNTESMSTKQRTLLTQKKQLKCSKKKKKEKIQLPPRFILPKPVIQSSLINTPRKTYDANAFKIRRDNRNSHIIDVDKSGMSVEDVRVPRNIQHVSDAIEILGSDVDASDDEDSKVKIMENVEQKSNKERMINQYDSLVHQNSNHTSIIDNSIKTSIDISELEQPNDALNIDDTKCIECGKVFMNSHQYRIHQLMHTLTTQNDNESVHLGDEESEDHEAILDNIEIVCNDIRFVNNSPDTATNGESVDKPQSDVIEIEDSDEDSVVANTNSTIFLILQENRKTCVKCKSLAVSLNENNECPACVISSPLFISVKCANCKIDFDHKNSNVFEGKVLCNSCARERLTCVLCSEKSVSLQDLQIHTRQKHFCNICCKHVTNLNKHKMSQVVCEICKKVLCTKFNVQQHYKISHRQHYCSKCGSTFNSDYSLYVHSQKFHSLK